MLTNVGTRYNGMELSPERVAAFFIASPPAPLRVERGVDSEIPLYVRQKGDRNITRKNKTPKPWGIHGAYFPLHYFSSLSDR